MENILENFTELTILHTSGVDVKKHQCFYCLLKGDTTTYAEDMGTFVGDDYGKRYFVCDEHLKVDE